MTYFSFIKPRTFDLIVIGIYALISVFIFYLVKSADPNTYFKDFSKIGLYCIATQIFMFHVLYKHFRNLTNTIFWILVGIFHLYLALLFINKYKIRPKDLVLIGWFLNTLFLVFFIQFLRVFSLMQTKQEFIVPFKFMHLFDLIDQRKSTIVDNLLLVLYYIAFFGLPFLWNKFL